jgi:hypothetical protein
MIWLFNVLINNYLQVTSVVLVEVVPLIVTLFVPALAFRVAHCVASVISTSESVLPDCVVFTLQVSQAFLQEVVKPIVATATKNNNFFIRK